MCHPARLRACPHRSAPHHTQPLRPPCTAGEVELRHEDVIPNAPSLVVYRWGPPSLSSS